MFKITEAEVQRGIAQSQSIFTRALKQLEKASIKASGLKQQNAKERSELNEKLTKLDESDSVVNQQLSQIQKMSEKIRNFLEG